MKTNFTYTAKYTLYLQSILIAFATFLLLLSGGNSLRAEGFEGVEGELNNLRVEAEDGILADPVAIDTTVSLAENSPIGTAVDTVTASDADNDALTYSITGGNTASAFAIDALTGEITVADVSQLDHETTTQFVLTVKVTDGIASDDALITIDINDVDEAPTVSIISPQAGDPFSAPADITITAEASDPDAGGSVTRVDFYKETDLLGTGINGTDGWSFNWTGVAAGNYSLTAIAFDNNGESTTSVAVEITVSGANNSPTVTIISPAVDEEFTTLEDILIVADPSDSDGSVTKVEFFASTVKLGEDTDGTDGWSFNWTDASAGNYKLTAIATDNLGAPTTSPEVNIVVSGPNTPPTVTITTPIEGEVFADGDPILITANASDTDGTIAKVEFFKETVKLGEDTDGTDGWSYNWTDAAGGNYSLTAIATDNAGAPTTSDEVNIVVSGPNTPPTVSISSPAAGTSFTAPVDITITAVASDPDTDGSVVKVEFFAGNLKLGETFNGTNGWNYTWLNVAAGTYSLIALATDDQGAITTSSEVEISVVLGTPINVAPDSTCGPGPVILSADPGSGGDAVRWYDASSGGTNLDTTSLGQSYTTDIISTTTSYWISTYNTSTLEESSRIEVVAIVKPVPNAPTSVGPYTSCSGENPTVASLPDGGGSYKWYNSLGATENLDPTSPLATGNYSYFVTTTNTDGCESAKTEVNIQVNPTPLAPSVAAQEFCSDEAATVADLDIPQDPGTYTWYGENTPTATALDPSEALATGTYYLTSTVDGCESEKASVSVTIHPQPAPPQISPIRPSGIYYTGEDTSITLTGSPNGGYFTVDGTPQPIQNTFSFNPCTFSVGAHTISYTYTDPATGCSSSTDYNISIQRSTYSVIMTADPFTICAGQNTVYTATVYRDVEVIYPYTESIYDIDFRDNSTYNEAYTAYYNELNNVTDGPSEIERAYPERLLQPIPINPDPTLSIADQLNIPQPLNPQNFSYQWERNGSDQGPKTDVRSISALSSTDYIRVKVEPKQTNLCVDPAGPTIIGSKGEKYMASNYLFFSEPNYNINLGSNPPINICAGDNSVEITLQRGEFKWTEANSEIIWKLRRNGQEYTLQTISIPEDATEAELEEYFSLSAEEIRLGLEAQVPAISPSELIDNDEVFIDYISDIDREVRKKCGKTPTYNRSDIVDVTVNDLEAAAADQSKEICETGSHTFTVNATRTGTAPISYQWYFNGVLDENIITGGTGSAISIDDAQEEDEGSYWVKVTNGCQEIGPINAGTLTVNPLDIRTGELTYTWLDHNKWEIRALNNGTPFGPEYSFRWYRYDDAGAQEWVLQPQVTGDTFIEENGSADIQIKAEVVNMDPKSCIQYNFDAPAMNPLPVEIFSFAAEQQGGQVVLKWSTAMEKDNTGFEVQVSADARDFQTIAFVETKNGDSNAIQEYAFVDQQSGMTGRLYYRLKQIDIDGASSLFGPVYIEVKNLNAVAFYPNPFKDQLTAEIKAEGAGELVISLTNSLGTLVMQKTLPIKEGMNIEELFPATTLPGGVYFVFVQMNGLSKQYKLMKH